MLTHQLGFPLPSEVNYEGTELRKAMKELGSPDAPARSESASEVRPELPKPVNSLMPPIGSPPPNRPSISVTPEARSLGICNA
jgi:hypothetical protein